MSKKSLSDLLREEVHKKPTSESSGAPESSTQSLSNPQVSTEESSMSPSTGPAKRNSKPKAAPAGSKAMSSGRLTKAELDTKVVSLTEALAAAKKAATETESVLSQQVTELEATVAQQNKKIQSLQSSLAQSQSIKSDLDLAKKDALKLAQENERLQTQNQELKTQVTSLKSSLNALPKGASNASPKASLKKASKPPSRQSRRSLPPPSRSILERPIKPAQNPSQTGKSSRNFDTWCYD